MISVTVERHVGSDWKITPEPNTPHLVEMLDIALQTHKAFEVVVPHGEYVVGLNTESDELSNKVVKRIKRAVRSAALGEKFEVRFEMGK